MSNSVKTPSIKEGIAFYRENSEVASNGVRKIPKEIFLKRMSDAHGITSKEISAVQDAINHETTVAAHVSLMDLEAVIKETPKKILEDEEALKEISSTTRLPTFGGSTEVSVYAVKVHNIPSRPDADGNTERGTKTTYGRVKTSVKTEMRVDKSFHDESRNRMRKALGIK